MVFRCSHGIGRWSQLRLVSFGGHCQKLSPSNLERVAGSIGIVLARPRAGNGWTGACVMPLCRRTYANKPVSRPKAHTGRTRSAPKKNAATRTKTNAAAQSTRKKAPLVGQAKRKSSTAVKSRPKAPPKKKKPRAKPKAKRRPRKLSEEGKLRLAKQKEAAGVKQLKERALSPPSRRSTAWVVFLTEQITILRESGDLGGGSGIGSVTKEISLKYRALSPAQLEVRLA